MLHRERRGEVLWTWCSPAPKNSLKEVKTGGSLGCSDNALGEFVISRNKGLAKGKGRALNLRRANFKLF